MLTARLPWHMRYASFAGTLPNITSITSRVIGGEFLILVRILGIEVSCLYLTSTTEPGIETSGREAGGSLTGVSLSGEIRSATGGTCARGRLSGSGSLTSAGGGSLRVTLVA